MATISLLDAVPAGVTVKLASNASPAASALRLVGEVAHDGPARGCRDGDRDVVHRFRPVIGDRRDDPPGRPTVRPSGASSVNVTAGSGRCATGRPLLDDDAPVRRDMSHRDRQGLRGGVVREGRPPVDGHLVRTGDVDEDGGVVARRRLTGVAARAGPICSAACRSSA